MGSTMGRTVMALVLMMVLGSLCLLALDRSVDPADARGSSDPSPVGDKSNLEVQLAELTSVLEAMAIRRERVVPTEEKPSDALVVEAEDWWTKLPRKKAGWFVNSVSATAAYIRNPRSYARCLDLNPRDKPLSKKQFEHLSRLAALWAEDWERVAELQNQIQYAEVTKLHASGRLPEFTKNYIEEKHPGIFEQELRILVKHNEVNKRELPDTIRLEGLAVHNSIVRLGLATVVLRGKDGAVFGAVDSDLPETSALNDAILIAKERCFRLVVDWFEAHGCLAPAEREKLISVFRIKNSF